MPWWYGFIRTAKYLGVAPWVLAGIGGRPHWLWANWAAICERVEIGVHNAAIQRANRK